MVREMETYQGNLGIGDVILQTRAHSRRPQWITQTRWHWRPKPGLTEFTTLSKKEGYPVALTEKQRKGLLKIYRALIRPADWLPALGIACTAKEDAFVEDTLTTIESRMEYVFDFG